MDTKLKNRHKLAVIIIIAAILAASSVMVSMYPVFFEAAESEKKTWDMSYFSSEEFLGAFIESSYILYDLEEEGQEEGQEEPAVNPEERLSHVFPYWRSIVEDLHPYADYEVEDEREKVLYKNMVNTASGLSADKLDSYEFGLALTYDSERNLTVDKVSGVYADDQAVVIKKLVQDVISGEWPKEKGTYDPALAPEMPCDRTYLYGMTGDNMESYLQNKYSTSIHAPVLYNYVVLGLAVLIGIMALLLPLLKSFRTGEEKIFHAPLEAVIVTVALLAGLLGHISPWLITRDEGEISGLDVLLWPAVFAAVYWIVSCIRQIWVLGIRRYIKERLVCLPLFYRLKKGLKSVWRWGKEGLDRLYESLNDIDFSDKNNKVILKIVLINFVVLVVLCSLWFFGILGLIVYSVLLFIILRKYFNDLRGKYAVLLKATNEIAEGNLDVEITEDIGVFTPFKTEIEKIQSGFKKAVKEEVKSQKLKTELITNVSHDLKTPLTAIITYVNLLKDETDEEKRKNYTDILEQKSLRLKSLIEDLFEISKASSENVKLDLMYVDIVNLYKQVQLEQQDKIEKAGLTFRCSYPDEKVMLLLDNQKTYRIFENLLVNITKYSMPDTRVYVDITKEDTEIVIRMKNISATELDFDPAQLTERFVRGDAARNTEGSGLGLAIAKSFVELQKGTFKIGTEADLFKAEIRWPYVENQKIRDNQER